MTMIATIRFLIKLPALWASHSNIASEKAAVEQSGAKVLNTMSTMKTTMTTKAVRLTAKTDTKVETNALRNRHRHGSASAGLRARLTQ